MEQILKHLDPANPCIMGCPKQKHNQPPPTPCRACTSKDPEKHCRNCYKNQIAFYRHNLHYKKNISPKKTVQFQSKDKSTDLKNGTFTRATNSISNRSLSRIPIQAVSRLNLYSSDSDDTNSRYDSVYRKQPLRNTHSSYSETSSTENDYSNAHTSKKSSDNYSTKPYYFQPRYYKHNMWYDYHTSTDEYDSRNDNSSAYRHKKYSDTEYSKTNSSRRHNSTDQSTSSSSF